MISHRRYEEIDPDDNLRGAPELVIEVKSPSNSRKRLQELAALCLANGAHEFRIVDPAARTVAVIRSEGSAVLYSSGDSIPLNAFAGAPNWPSTKSSALTPAASLAGVPGAPDV